MPDRSPLTEHAAALAGTLLGKATHYPDRYDASLLEPLPRAPKRAELGLAGQPPFVGADAH